MKRKTAKTSTASPKKGKHTPNSTVIQIGRKTYAHPDHVAELLNVTRRTLNRWTQDRRGPPKIVIGQRALYDLDKLSLWLEANEIAPLSQMRGNK
ncbi:MAG: hypothetical protein KAS85_00370 [Rhodobacteraceae bacterium]|nr:hypothetical protein [Paracoccaceae bacterium]